MVMKKIDLAEQITRHTHRLDEDDPISADWQIGQEVSLIAVLEAHRRFVNQGFDTRTAAALTMAWGALEGGKFAHSES